MIDPSSKPQREVSIADHIWNTFEDMASQMGSDRDALINQAMFMFARLNGFMDTGSSGAVPAGKPALSHMATKAPSSGLPGTAPTPAPARNAPAAPVPPMMKPAAGGRGPETASGNMDDDPGRRAVADRVLQTAAELERLIKSKNQPPPAPPPASGSVNINGEGDSAGSDIDLEGSGDGHALYMQVEGGELDRIAKDRFVIGRGKHCDFVVNSGKVSREHTVIVREGTEFFIEDLGSSNGTWFNKQRIKRRRVEDGDEYFICSEKVKFVYR